MSLKHATKKYTKAPVKNGTFCKCLSTKFSLIIKWSEKLCKKMVLCNRFVWNYFTFQNLTDWFKILDSWGWKKSFNILTKRKTALDIRWQQPGGIFIKSKCTLHEQSPTKIFTQQTLEKLETRIDFEFIKSWICKIVKWREPIILMI